MKVVESLAEIKKQNLNEKEVLTILQKDCGLKLSEALEVCKSEFSNVDKFKEAAIDLRVDSLPNSGHMRPDGVTVITDDWEE